MNNIKARNNYQRGKGVILNCHATSQLLTKKNEERMKG